jgi:hypothetical protein
MWLHGASLDRALFGMNPGSGTIRNIEESPLRKRLRTRFGQVRELELRLEKKG